MEILAIIILFFIIIGLLVERYFYTKEMTSRLTQAMEAAMSRDMNDYIAARSVDKRLGLHAEPPDEVNIDEATEKEFMQHIEKVTQ